MTCVKFKLRLAAPNLRRVGRYGQPPAGSEWAVAVGARAEPRRHEWTGNRVLALPTVRPGSATFLAEIGYPVLWVQTTDGPAQVVIGYAQRATVTICLALLAGFIGGLVFGGAAEERYGYTG